MERPKGENRPVERAVTGETMYIQDRWQNSLEAGDYMRLPEAVRQRYEEDAATLTALGGRPSVMDLYERYDANQMPLYTSCAAFAEELFSLRDEYKGAGTTEQFGLPLPPHVVLARLRQLRAGSVLLDDAESIPMLSPGLERAPDVRKDEATLTNAWLQVWRVDGRKYVLIEKPNAEPELIPYPENETACDYRIDLVFEYHHPAAGPMIESVGLSVDMFRGLSVDREMYVPENGGQDDGGLYNAALDNPSEQDIAEFADFIAEIAGDVPEPLLRVSDNGVKYDISRIANSISRAYLTELLMNTSESTVRRCLATRMPSGETLRDSLASGTNDEANDMVTMLVNAKRAYHGKQTLIAKKGGVEVSEWRDWIKR